MRLRPVYTLQRSQRVPIGVREAFDFFERPANLPRITPPWLDLRILTPEPLVMRRGLELDYRVRVLGVRTRWRSAIAEYDPPRGFRDVQVIGPYRRWSHRHLFHPDGEGARIEDVVVYQLPWGPVGAAVHALVVGRRLREIFDYRAARIEVLLGGRSGPAGALGGE